MSSLLLRAGGEADTAAVAELFAACLPEAWPEASIGRVAAEPGGCLLVAEDEGALVGALLLRTVAGEAEVLLVAVAPSRRGRGLGRLLLRRGEAAAIGAGAGRVFLEVRAGNRAALGLYLSSGYEQVGCRSGYYDNGEDALVLARDLLPPPLPGA